MECFTQHRRFLSMNIHFNLKKKWWVTNQISTYAVPSTFKVLDIYYLVVILT